LVVLCLILSFYPAHAASNCRGTGVWLQVLGSGGPELIQGRASTSYLVWQDGKARVLVDMGSGSMLRFEQSGARIEDLEVILLSHLHVDHSADIPALVKAAYFGERTRDLPIYGPSGNALMPDTSAFLQSLLGEPDGAYRYLAGYLDGNESFRLVPRVVAAEGTSTHLALDRPGLKLTAVPVHHGPIPSLAWRVDIGGRSLAFSGDMNGDNGTLSALAAGADLLVAHNAIPEGAKGAARNLHMPPSVIGEIAAAAGIRQLVLSHRMKRTLGREQGTTKEIRKRYGGPLMFADDLQCFRVVR
jgi:ribonuclease BN (tRNA processing enzyme)